MRILMMENICTAGDDCKIYHERATKQVGSFDKEIIHWISYCPSSKKTRYHATVKNLDGSETARDIVENFKRSVGDSRHEASHSITSMEIFLLETEKL
jgi:hypothetical protein